jgi:hypothetical protein
MKAMRSSSLAVAVLLGGVLLTGCSSKLAPVSGRVTCDGKPLECAAITLSPLPENANDLESPRAANGGINNGRLEYVSTFKQGDGAVIGKHRALITVEFPGSCPCLPTKEIILEVKPGNNEFNLELRDYSTKRQK